MKGGQRHIPQVKVRIRQENEHSIHVFEKLGAKYDGIFPYYSPEILETIRRNLPGQDLSELEKPTVHVYHFNIPIKVSKRTLPPLPQRCDTYIIC